jgi:CRISPR/Cas system CMR-associated protein Cmr1 (group 7 of RAMP superfamily)
MDDLKSGFGANIRTGIGNLTCNAPALADDIACIATSPRALQRMLDVCSDYSNKRRFQFNGNKSTNNKESLQFCRV